MAELPQCVVGIIGGTGVYKMEGLENPTPYTIETPFGPPSDAVTVAKVHGVQCAFLPRHGRNHSFLPSEVNYRANIFAMKKLGVKYLVSSAAVGSLSEDLQPGDFVLASQIIDKTFKRQSTFFGEGIVGHVAFGNPTCNKFRELVYAAAKDVKKWPVGGVTIHQQGTMVTMEGPQFSTSAESCHHKAIGAHVIGMTTATESKLAREAEMAHLVVCMVTDMDSWHPAHEQVDQNKVGETLAKNGANIQPFIKLVIKVVADNQFESEAHSALNGAILTAPAAIPPKKKADLAPLIGSHIKE